MTVVTPDNKTVPKPDVVIPGANLEVVNALAKTLLKIQVNAAYYINIAKAVAVRSKCSRRRFGAVIVLKDSVVSTGFNGSARGTLNCGAEIECLKDVNKEAPYKSYNYCPGVHAEENAIINGGRERVAGGTLYLAPILGEGDRPCIGCIRRILNAGIRDCWYIDKDGKLKYELVKDWIELDNQWMRERLNVDTENDQRVPYNA